MTAHLRRDLRAIAIDWTAWGGIGMASRGSIPKMMALAGIDMLSPEAGVPVVRHELTAGGTRGEVVIGQRLGAMTEEWDIEGGLDTAAFSASRGTGSGPMIGRVTGFGLFHGLGVETTLDPKEQPFLFDHQIEGTPVLPGVMGIESFAELATLPLLGWQVAAVEDVDFLVPVKFFRGEPRVLLLNAVFLKDGEDIIAECRLSSNRTLPGQKEPTLTTHFTGRVRLSRAAVKDERLLPCAAPADTSVHAPDIYRIYFHGPAYRVLSAGWPDGGATCGELTADLPPNHHPASAPLLMAPRLVELCFQAAGLPGLAESGQMALPQHVDRVSVDSDWKPEGALRAVVTPAPGGGSDARVVTEAGHVVVELRGYRTVTLEGALDGSLLEPLRTAFPARS
jgi:hypothetical protein